MKKYIMDILTIIGIITMIIMLSLTECVNELHAWLCLSIELIFGFCLVVKISDLVVTIISKAFKKKKRS